MKLEVFNGNKGADQSHLIFDRGQLQAERFDKLVTRLELDSKNNFSIAKEHLLESVLSLKDLAIDAKDKGTLSPTKINSIARIIEALPLHLNETDSVVDRHNFCSTVVSLYRKIPELIQIAPDPVVSLLNGALENKLDLDVRQNLFLVVHDQGKSCEMDLKAKFGGVLKQIVKSLDHADTASTLRLIHALGQESKSDLPLIRSFVDPKSSSSPDVKIAAIEALCRLAPREEAIAAISQALGTNGHEMKIAQGAFRSLRNLNITEQEQPKIELDLVEFLDHLMKYRDPYQGLIHDVVAFLSNRHMCEGLTILCKRYPNYQPLCTAATQCNINLDEDTSENMANAQVEAAFEAVGDRGDSNHEE